jgi:multidrug transporter EmrE-like cation transporter
VGDPPHKLAVSLIKSIGIGLILAGVWVVNRQTAEHK